MIILSDVDLQNGFPCPGLRHGIFENGIVAGKLDVIQNAFRAETNGSPFSHFIFRIDHVVGAVPKEEFPLDLAGRTGNDPLRSVFFEKGRDLQRILETVAHRNEASVETVHAQRFQKIHIGRIADEGIDRVGKHRLDMLLVLIHRHDLIAQIIQLLAKIEAKLSCSDHQKCLVHHFLLIRP